MQTQAAVRRHAPVRVVQPPIACPSAFVAASLPTMPSGDPDVTSVTSEEPADRCVDAGTYDRLRGCVVQQLGRCTRCEREEGPGDVVRVEPGRPAQMRRHRVRSRLPARRGKRARGRRPSSPALRVPLQHVHRHSSRRPLAQGDATRWFSRTPDAPAGTSAAAARQANGVDGTRHTAGGVPSVPIACPEARWE
jgi:hypothetical protein